jgi:hypothetical protein
MRFERLVQNHVSGLHPMPAGIPSLLITPGEDERCIGGLMSVAADEGRADCLPNSHRSLALRLPVA